MESIAIKKLTALSHEKRLALFRLLVRRYPDEVPAGEIATELQCKANTTSVYLAALLEAGLVSKRREGTSLLYAADLTNARALFQYLLSDCCRDRLALCLPPAQLGGNTPGIDATTASKIAILFTCTGNSSRSICAEAILRDLMTDGTRVFSAGSHPATNPNPNMLQVLTAKGHKTSPLHPKNISCFEQGQGPRLDIVISLCDRIANKDRPAWAGQPLSSHWGLPAPSRSTQSAAQTRAAFEQTYAQLALRLERLARLDLCGMPRPQLQEALDNIGRTPYGALPS